MTVSSGTDLAKAEETTELLRRWARGSDECATELFERLYPDLRRLAGRESVKLDFGQSASDLAQELCIGLIRNRETNWHNRGHFFAIAARILRRTAVDAARFRNRAKRGGGATHVRFDEAPQAASRNIPSAADLLALDQALDELRKISLGSVKVVELRYFAGLSLEETAAVLEVSRSTVARRWSFAKSWLYEYLGDST